MSFGEEGIQFEETLGPGTDLVISLFSTFLVLGVLGAALANTPSDEGPAPEPEPPKENVIFLDPVRDGNQYFKRQSAELDAAGAAAIIEKLRPMQVSFAAAKGQLLVHVIGHASPEPFGFDEGEANFRLALQRAMTIAGLAHRELRIPFECLRVHGYGRGESDTLKTWLTRGAENSLRDWDAAYRIKREQEKKSWATGEQEWSAAYATGQTGLGRELAAERRVVLKTERAGNDVLCARALAEEKVHPADKLAARATPVAPVLRRPLRPPPEPRAPAAEPDLGEPPAPNAE